MNKKKLGVIAFIVLILLIGALIIAFAFYLNFSSSYEAIYTEDEEPPDTLRPPHNINAPHFGGAPRFDQIKLGNIVFNPPETLNINDSALIQLNLSLKIPINELKKSVEAVGEIQGERIKVSDIMIAKLTGPNFSITPVTPEEQAISEEDITQWKWEVIPKKRGKQRLHLALSMILNINGKNVPSTVETFSRDIEIDIRWDQKAQIFIGNNWQWLWVAIIFPVLGWIINRYRRKKE